MIPSSTTATTATTTSNAITASQSAGAPVSKDKVDSQTTPSTSKDLQELRQTFLERIDTAKKTLLADHANTKILTEALVNKFGLFENVEQREESVKNYLALMLAQFNLQTKEEIADLAKVFTLQEKIEKTEDQDARKVIETELKELEGKKLPINARADNNYKIGNHRMGVHRQSFIEEQVNELFDLEIRQEILNALMIVKTQLLFGYDIGPINESIANLTSGNIDDLAKFTATFKFPNDNVFQSGRENLEEECKALENHFKSKNEPIEALIKELQDSLKELQDSLNEHDKQLNEHDKQMIKTELSKPVSEMTIEALVLAAVYTPPEESDLKFFLKSAQILLLKTQAQTENPELSGKFAIAKGLELSDEKVRKHYTTGPKNAPASAAKALVQSVTPPATNRDTTP